MKLFLTPARALNYKQIINLSISYLFSYQKTVGGDPGPWKKRPLIDLNRLGYARTPAHLELWNCLWAPIQSLMQRRAGAPNAQNELCSRFRCTASHHLCGVWWCNSWPHRVHNIDISMAIKTVKRIIFGRAIFLLLFFFEYVAWRRTLAPLCILPDK